MLLSDTVGFIRKLPHHLVESFKSTLDEVIESDVLLHVVDISHPNFEDQISVVNETLRDLNAREKPVIMVFNKMDLYRERYFDKYLKDEVKEEIMTEMKKSWMEKSYKRAVFISALQKEGIADLREMILSETAEKYRERFPYQVKTVYGHPGWEE
jgi:GTP-binding protein HflX